MIDVPEDLTGLTDEQLAELADQIRTAGEELGDSALNDEDALAQLETLVAELGRINAEIGTRDERNAARGDRVASALNAIGAHTDDPTTDTPAEPSPSQPEPVAATLTPGAPTLVQEAAVADPDNHPVIPDPVAALAATATTVTAPVTTVTDTPGHRPLARFMNSGAVLTQDKGNTVDRADIARLIMDKHRQLSRYASYDPVILARAVTNYDPEETITADSYEANFTVMENAANRAQSLVASGANCALLTPYYDVFDVAEPMSPVENALVTVGAPRGGIRYVQPPQWPEAADGVRFTTGAQDAAGYTTQDPSGPTAPKPCVRMDCPPPLECTVDAVSSCITFGNLQYNTFRELVEVVLNHLAVSYAQTKEIFYLDAIEDGSTLVNFTQTYSATRSLVMALATAAWGQRKRLHMPMDAPLDALAPDTMIPVIRADMVNDLHLGLSFLNANPQQVADEIFRALNINVSWYYDYSTDSGAPSSMQIPQGPGALNNLPTTFRTYLFPRGTWIRLDGGTLDLGIVRDSGLISTNDFEIFAEEWTQVCKRGDESLAIDIDLVANGVGPCCATAIDYGS